MKLFAVSAVLVAFSAVAYARGAQEEKSPHIKELENFETNSVRGGFLADLSGTCIDSLLAASPPCSMQDQCDMIVDMAYFIGGAKKGQLIKMAQALMQAEKNTPEQGQRSVDCNRLPRHPELNGLFATQDPTKGPGSKLKPFAPTKLEPVRKFSFKANGKTIAPGGRFQKAGTQTRGVTPKFNGKIDDKPAPTTPTKSPALALINKINMGKLSKSQKAQLTTCKKILEANNKSKQVRTNCENTIKTLAKKFPKK